MIVCLFVCLCIDTESHYVDQDGLEVRDPPFSALQTLRSKACAMPGSAGLLDTTVKL